MLGLKITDNDGNTYTDMKTFYSDYLDNESYLPDESWNNLMQIVWEYIEKYDGDIPDYIEEIFVVVDDFTYCFVEKYEYERIVDDYDLYKGWESFTYILKSPLSGEYFSLSGYDYANDGPDYVDGYKFTKVKPVEVKNIIWETDNG